MTSNLCVCGHREEIHKNDVGRCTVYHPDGQIKICECSSFRPAEPVSGENGPGYMKDDDGGIELVAPLPPPVEWDGALDFVIGELGKHIHWDKRTYDGPAIEARLNEIFAAEIAKAEERVEARHSDGNIETPPTLSELIEACGFGFRSLSLHSDGRWLAKSGHNALPTSKLFTGHSPEEAVAKLWLVLQTPAALECIEPPEDYKGKQGVC